MQDKSDQELIKEILAGSLNSYHMLIERYQLQVQSALNFYCRNQKDVEQFMHETFTKAYFKLNKLDLKRPILPWLKRIALNLLRDEIRRQDRHTKRVTSYFQTKLDQHDQSETFSHRSPCQRCRPSIP